ncbi:MAG: vitamin K epoxide reductase family protein [Rothia sp. (in: high G+C Gram-positive bacteria)]|uniref:vitamin K epoxide reductase family protein n=1 Tax=Rothia sp. (in: high G+C Gram-positive bacteria) TaxID=1885016 RepID=UPI0026DFE64E|nr:vitamin K epoxide reductase family protein [Rothia sp. (in: high G+C Gram-positive bacteria)]MDO5750899.1 vitamin K epoxide reductase family protein [Rothia sp. (in: high G+C Gram-positive bacteria)]
MATKSLDTIEDTPQDTPISKELSSIDRTLGWWLVITAGISLASSLILSYERMAIYIDAGHSSVCDINALLNCGTVMRTPQAATFFGFPNPFVGLMAYTALLTVGVAMLAGARFKPWFWWCVQAGVTFALGFVVYLWFQTTFIIGALCLFCMIVWIMTVIMLVKVSVRNIQAGLIRLPATLRDASKNWEWFTISILLLIIFGTVLIHFMSVIVQLFA